LTRYWTIENTFITLQGPARSRAGEFGQSLGSVAPPVKKIKGRHFTED
jgi:hypothetical protein